MIGMPVNLHSCEIMIIISVASWEERFVKGAEHLIDTMSPNKIVILYLQEFSERTANNRKLVSQFAIARRIEIREVEIQFSTSIQCWSRLAKFLPEIIEHGSEVAFDISTSPREVLWYTLHILDVLECQARWVYHRPLSYGDEWLSRNALSPRLLLKRSGIALPGRKTCLIALAGFDSERLAQLIERFEPARCFIGRQTGTQLNNDVRNAASDEVFANQKEIEIFDFNCYDTSPEAHKYLLSKIPDEIWECYNVIGASLGPKPSAITMFDLTNIRPEIGLVYVPSGEYSANYSIGIDLSSVSEGMISNQLAAT